MYYIDFCTQARTGKLAVKNIRTNKFLTRYIYDECEWYGNLINVKRKGKQGFINEYGNEIVPCKYDDISMFFIKGYAQVKNNDKYGFVNINGEEFIPCKYEGVNHFSSEIVGVKMNGKWGYIDKTDQIVIPFKYDCTTSFNDGLTTVKLSGKTSL